MKAIYRKLGVKGRSSAVDRACSLGILPGHCRALETGDTGVVALIADTYSFVLGVLTLSERRQWTSPPDLGPL